MPNRPPAIGIDAAIVSLNVVAAAAGISVFGNLNQELQRRIGAGIGLQAVPYASTIGVLVVLQLILTLAVRDVERLHHTVELAGGWLDAMTNALHSLRMAMAISSTLLWAAIPLLIAPDTRNYGLAAVACITIALLIALGSYVYFQWLANRRFYRWIQASGNVGEPKDTPSMFRNREDSRFLVLHRGGGVAFNTAHPRLRLYLLLCAAMAAMILTGLLTSSRG